MASTVTLSSAGLATIMLDPVPKSTTVGLSVTSGSSTSVVTVEMTLDTPGVPGGAAMTWFTLSSGAAMLSSAVTNVVYTVLSPIGGVRINSSLNTNTVYTLKALQSITA